MCQGGKKSTSLIHGSLPSWDINISTNKMVLNILLPWTNIAASLRIFSVLLCWTNKFWDLRLSHRSPHSNVSFQMRGISTPFTQSSFSPFIFKMHISFCCLVPYDLPPPAVFQSTSPVHSETILWENSRFCLCMNYKFAVLRNVDALAIYCCASMHSPSFFLNYYFYEAPVNQWNCSVMSDPLQSHGPTRLPIRLLHHGIFQERVLEWVPIFFSRGSSQTRDWTQVSCIAGRHFTIWATREARYEGQ